jgi:two-component system, chemotaxis family, response regulator Rcp1
MRNRVLLVEDNRADAVLVQLAIDDSGLDLELQHFIDGELMMNHLVNGNPDGVSFILLDLNIPKANGVEILQARERSEAWSLVPVVVYSSSTRQEDIRNCLKSGANAYICKQVDFEVFNQNLQSSFKFWHQIALRS